MLRIPGDISLLVLIDRKQLNQIFISGVAADYSTGEARLVKMELDCIEETSIVNQSIETIPFHEALNIMLNAIVRWLYFWNV